MSAPETIFNYRTFGVKQADLPPDLRAAVALGEQLQQATRVSFPVTSWKRVGNEPQISKPADMDLRLNWLDYLRKILKDVAPAPLDPSPFITLKGIIDHLETIEIATDVAKMGGIAFWVDRRRKYIAKPDDDLWLLKTCIRLKLFMNRTEIFVAFGR